MTLGGPGPLIAVPLYRAPELVAPLFAGLAAMADEIAGLDARVLLLVDSPGDAGLDAALVAELPALAASVGVELLENSENLGFVRTANRALTIALAEGRDAILLNSDALPVPGAFAEMVAVARLDPNISVVSPRSDNATICNSPAPYDLRGTGAEALAAHSAIEPILPRVTYVPTAVGFCLLIRHAMLTRFGLFDEAYGGGYNEENDLIRRCHAHGFRAALANRAYAFHTGGVSFGTGTAREHARDAANRAILDARYPDYTLAVRRWFEGPVARAENLIAGLLPAADGRLRLLVDARHLDAEGAALARAFGVRHARRWDVRLLCDAETWVTHRLDTAPGIRRIDMAEARHIPAAIAFRPGACPDLMTLATLCDTAPLVALSRSGPIDPANADEDEPGGETLLRFTLDVVALIAHDAGTRDDAARRGLAAPADVRDLLLEGDADERADRLAAAFDAIITAIDFDAVLRRQVRLVAHGERLLARIRRDEARAAAYDAEARRRELVDALATPLSSPADVRPLPRFGRRGPSSLDLSALADADATVDALLDAPRQTLRVLFSRAVLLATAPEPAIAARLLLAAAGLIPLRFGGTIAEAAPGTDWRLPLKLPLDDAEFVRHAYRAVLGRDPDASEAAAPPLGREALLRALQRSAERHARLAALL